jgi:hypothetical protein
MVDGSAGVVDQDDGEAAAIGDKRGGQVPRGEPTGRLGQPDVRKPSLLVTALTLAWHPSPGSRAAGLAMAFKLIEAAQDRWRAVNTPHLVALVRAGATFVNGQLVERPAEAVAA